MSLPGEVGYQASQLSRHAGLKHWIKIFDAVYSVTEMIFLFGRVIYTALLT